MPGFSRVQKYVIIGIGALSGAGLAYYKYAVNLKEPIAITNGNKNDENNNNNDWPINFTPVKWDRNWDRRDPKSLIKPMKIKNEEDENKYNEAYESHKPKAVRHLLLIRHGQYNMKGNSDAEKILTEIGRQQADSTGKRLAQLNLPYSLIVRSTMSRAQETAKIIEKSLANVPVMDDSILVEGAPIPPEPPLSNWKPDYHYYQDGARIEAAFRKYFHRAKPKQEKDSYTVLVCHANVIRYFICRALQFPPEAWARLSLKNGSITWVSILPSGNVVLRSYGEASHMIPELLTTH